MTMNKELQYFRSLKKYAEPIPCKANTAYYHIKFHCNVQEGRDLWLIMAKDYKWLLKPYRYYVTKGGDKVTFGGRYHDSSHAVKIIKGLFKRLKQQRSKG